MLEEKERKQLNKRDGITDGRIVGNGRGRRDCGFGFLERGCCLFVDVVCGWEWSLCAVREFEHGGGRVRGVDRVSLC